MNYIAVDPFGTVVNKTVLVDVISNSSSWTIMLDGPRTRTVGLSQTNFTAPFARVVTKGSSLFQSIPPNWINYQNFVAGIPGTYSAQYQFKGDPDADGNIIFDVLTIILVDDIPPVSNVASSFHFKYTK